MGNEEEEYQLQKLIAFVFSLDYTLGHSREYGDPGTQDARHK
jgi:hypothetical protein